MDSGATVSLVSKKVSDVLLKSGQAKSLNLSCDAIICNGERMHLNGAVSIDIAYNGRKVRNDFYLMPVNFDYEDFILGINCLEKFDINLVNENGAKIGYGLNPVTGNDINVGNGLKILRKNLRSMRS